MLIEVHILQNHVPSNMNRDDTGSPKEAVFGGHRRARISSQCLKRSVRRSELFQTALKGRLATRTRSLPERVRQLLAADGMDADVLDVVAQKVSGFGTDAGKEQTAKGGRYRTAQTMFLTDADVEAVAAVLKAAADQAKKPDALKKKGAQELQKEAEDRGCRPMAVDVALFGRMVTSEAFVDVEASSQFAHAISTHKVDHEFDYYTAVDDLERDPEDEAGAGADMIGDTEFNSACYYKYFNVHFDGLVENLTGEAFGRKDKEVTDADREGARQVATSAVRAVIEAAVRVTPSAKQNSFAAFQLPSVVLVEVRPDNLPVSYANAFACPVDPRMGDGVVAESQKRLKDEAERLTRKFALRSTARVLLAADDSFSIDGVRGVGDLAELLDAVEAAVRSDG